MASGGALPYFILGFETFFRTGLGRRAVLSLPGPAPKPHTWPSPQELASDPGFLTTVLCALGGFSLLLGLASCEQRLQRWTRALSGLVWAALLALGHGFLFTGGVVSAWDQVRGAAGGAGGWERDPGPRTCTRTPIEQSSSVSLQLLFPPPGVLLPLCHLHHVCHVALGHAGRHGRGPHLLPVTPAGPRAVSWASTRLKTCAAAAGECACRTGCAQGRLRWALLGSSGHSPTL